MENVPIEIERKYIISKPNFSSLVKENEYHRSEIVQIYLSGAKNATHRIRKRSDLSHTVYTETVKVRIDGMSAYEDEREIFEQDFTALSAKIADGTRPIRKVRHTFRYGDLTFEIDEYPEWENTCIMEIELPTREKSFKIPDFINIIREVTGDGAYSNAAMSRAFPKEDE
ncbi:MAG: hypothetical protein J6V09_01965 [Clostridia bacterium]|nr:hypothetical protein [Clostridia bacterium]